MRVVAVRTTGIYCRTSCPARKPRPENVVRFDSIEAARKAGFRACKRCRPDGDTRAEAAIKRAIAFIDAHLDEELPLGTIARESGMSTTYFQRIFTRALGVSPRMYVATRRAQELKSHLKRGETVLKASHNAGFPGQKQAYAHANDALGMSPGAYRRGGSGEQLVYTVASTALGKTLVATTKRGVAAVAFADDASKLVDDLRAEFPNAQLSAAGAKTPGVLKRRLMSALRAVRERIAGDDGREVKLDLIGSDFQRKVWRAIGRVRRGKTSTYTEIARKIGRPDAVRAVATACGANRIAVVIPCHRIVRSDGNLGGYRWGRARKRTLLQTEVA